MTLVRYLLIAFAASISTNALAQCPAGQVPVALDVHTDMYGYEIYWQIVPAGNPCGAGTIGFGGNDAVGCNGASVQAQIPGGYGDHMLYSEGPWCLPLDSSYTLYYIDDWGDGGPEFTVTIDGYPVYSGLTGTGAGPAGTTFNFSVTLPPPYDIGAVALTMPVYVNIGNAPLQVAVFNFGTETITSFTLHYTIDGGTPVSEIVSGVSIAPFTSYQAVSSLPMALPANGMYAITAWVSNPNGQQDENPTNDVVAGQIHAGPVAPNLVANYLGTTPVKNIQGTAADGLDFPRDLDFHPILTRNELWVVNRRTENQGGSTVTYYNAGLPNQSALMRVDGNAWHFMSLPTGIAFSDNGNFATSPGVYDANHNGGDYFTGPTLWSSDSLIYAQPSPGNGSHLDMLHESPYSMGIAWETGNAFWVFDGYHNSPVRYDFVEDHGPGMHDHSDGIIRRYTGLNLQAEPTYTVPSHLVLDHATNWLYIVDTGNERVLRLDITSGMQMGTYPAHEPVAEYSNYGMSTWEVVADNGLVEPSGCELMGQYLLVSDHANGDIVIYDISDVPYEAGRIYTNDPGIMGIKIGPDGSIWYVNGPNNQLVKLQAPLMVPQAAFTAPSSVCPGACVVYTNQSANADTYQWSFPGGNPGASNEDNPTVCYDSPGSYGVTLISINAFGSDTVTYTNYIEVFPHVVAPPITQSGGLLSVPNTFATFQWMLNGQSIPGAESNSLEPMQDGAYTVVVTDANGCQAQSNSIAFTNLSPADIDSRVMVFPNPTNALVNVTAASPMRRISIEDATGRTVMSFELQQALGHTFSIDGLAQGLYIVSIQTSAGLVRKQLVKVDRQ